MAAVLPAYYLLEPLKRANQLCVKAVREEEILLLLSELSFSLCGTLDPEKISLKFNKTDHLASFHICFEAQFIFESVMLERSPSAATCLQRWNS